MRVSSRSEGEPKFPQKTVVHASSMITEVLGQSCVDYGIIVFTVGTKVIIDMYLVYIPGTSFGPIKMYQTNNTQTGEIFVFI